MATIQVPILRVRQKQHRLSGPVITLGDDIEDEDGDSAITENQQHELAKSLRTESQQTIY